LKPDDSLTQFVNFSRDIDKISAAIKNHDFKNVCMTQAESVISGANVFCGLIKHDDKTTIEEQKEKALEVLTGARELIGPVVDASFVEELLSDVKHIVTLKLPDGSPMKPELCAIQKDSLFFPRPLHFSI